tara:strand:+ start:322470 stop:322760 length:291 start_codon:yes stop_codon:yes gene_type:complete
VCWEIAWIGSLLQIVFVSSLVREIPNHELPNDELPNHELIVRVLSVHELTNYQFSVDRLFPRSSAMRVVIIAMMKSVSRSGRVSTTIPDWPTRRWS